MVANNMFNMLGTSQILTKYKTSHPYCIAEVRQTHKNKSNNMFENKTYIRTYQHLGIPELWKMLKLIGANFKK